MATTTKKKAPVKMVSKSHIKKEAKLEGESYKKEAKEYKKGDKKKSTKKK